MTNTEKPLNECTTIEDICRITAIRDSHGHRWRRNGATMLWKKSPGRFRIPIKYGLYVYGEITNVHLQLKYFHPSTVAELADKPCPTRYP